MQIFTQKFMRNLGVACFCILVIIIVACPGNTQAQAHQSMSGSIVSVEIDSVQAASSVSLEQLFQGRAAGVRVTAADGAPGAAYDVLVRGINFIKGSNQPLYVLDGVILNPAQHDTRRAYWNDDSDYQMLQNSLNLINPMDIQKIEILKDAAATAIYGSMGANGVILITTKQGTPGGNRVKWMSNVSLSTPANQIDMLDKTSYLDYLCTKGASIPDGDEKNWQKAIDRTAISHNHFISLSGQGKDKTSYLISASFRRQMGVIEKSDATYTSFRLNVSRPLGKYAKIGTNTLFAYGEINMPIGTALLGQASIIKQSVVAAPLQFNFDPYSNDYVMDNPLQMIADYDDKSFEYRVIPSLFVEASLLPWLSLKSSVGVDFRDKKRQRWTGEGVYKGFLKSGMIGRADVAGVRYNFDNSLKAELAGSYGKIQALAGFSLNGDYFYDKIAEGYDLPLVAHNLRAKGMSASREVFTGNYLPYDFLMTSAYGQVSYSYANKYYLTATIRGDNYGSATPYWDTYPAISAAWEIGNERFMKHLRFVSGLKLRAGWGKSGIKEYTPYRYFPFSDSFEYTIDDDPVTHPIVAYNTYWHADLTEFNVGIDASLFQDRIAFSVDYFNRKTNEHLDILYSPTKNDTGTSVVTLPTKMDLEGFEASVDVKIMDRNDWNWTAGANIFFNTATIREAGSGSEQTFWFGNSIGTTNGIATPATIFAEGMAPGLFYGYFTKGLLNDRTAITSPSFRGNELSAGNIRFFDKDGNGVIDDLDKTYIGDPNPLFSFGFNTQLRYRNFTLRAEFYGSYGGEICNLNLLDELNTGNQSTYNVRKEAYADAWTSANPKGTYPAIGSYGMDEIGSRIIEDASFLRCADITVGYNISLPSSIQKWIKALNVAFSVKNAFVITNYSGYDPEVNSFSSDISRYGFDAGSYPRSRAFVLGVSATF